MVDTMPLRIIVMYKVMATIFTGRTLSFRILMGAKISKSILDDVEWLFFQRRHHFGPTHVHTCHLD